MISVTVSDGLRTVDLNAGVFRLARHDLGFPTIDAATEDAPNRDGIIDRTRHHRGRVATFNVIALPEATWADLTNLRSLLRPSARPVITISGDRREAPSRRAVARGSRFTHEADRSETVGLVGRIVAQWVLPDGIFESSLEQQEPVPVAVSTPVGGRTYDLSFDRDYPDAEPAGSISITSDGSTDAYPTIRVFGPCTGPKIEHTASDGTQSELSLPALSILIGDFVEIDTRARTVLYNADPNDSRYSELDFASSRWWTLQPGEQFVRFDPVTSSLPAQVVVTWRDAYI